MKLVVAPTSPLPLRRRLASAAFWAVVLTGYFMIVYSGCNWVASKRRNVGTWYYAWERYIPFIPASIVPYMSIDLFFFFSPLLCGSRAELRGAHAKRLALAITAAGVCFLLFPLRMGTTHEHPGGLYGLLFDLLGGFDRPSLTGKVAKREVSDKVFGAGEAITISDTTGAAGEIAVYPGLPFAMVRLTLRNAGTEAQVLNRVPVASFNATLAKPAWPLPTRPDRHRQS